MREKSISLFAAFCLAGCAPAPSPTSTVPPPKPAAAPAKLVPLDAAAASKEFAAAKALKGFAEVNALKIPTLTQADVDKGRDLYANNCAACHGENGEGDGPAGNALDPKPRNLTKPAQYEHGFRELAIFRTAKYGIENTGMAPWEGRMSDDEIWKVVFFVRGLQK
jgi:high-affinity iron transporter